MVEAAKREILEETGYTHIKFIKTLGAPVHAKFYHVHKKENRHARFHGLYFELEDRFQNPVSEEEKELCDMNWVSKGEVESHITAPDMKLIWYRVHAPETAYIGDGLLSNSGVFDGRGNEEAMGEIVDAIGGERVTQYRLRDWLVSRQRYWGCPIPIVYDPEGNPHAIPLEHLPWTLPTDVDFAPTGKSPLATSRELHERVERIFGKGWTPEYDTLDTFVDSSWYFMRYLDSKDAEEFSNQKLMKQWLPVNRYSGGSEHTTMHLLYARFFNKALYDLALAPTPEPFLERFNRGLILGPDGQKMSKSKGNVINPDEIVSKYGADAVRMYLAFLGPFNEAGSYPWNLDGVEAMRRFLDRIWRLSEKVSDGVQSAEELKLLAKTAKKVGDDAEKFKFNTAVSALMILVRDLESMKSVSRATYGDLLCMLAPFAPHVAESMWELQGFAGSVHQSMWPGKGAEFEDELATVIVQINSKKKGQLSVQKDASEDEVLTLAKEIPEISEKLQNDTSARVIYVPGRIINIVTTS
jgi:leucyl-tRNA synthetase